MATWWEVLDVCSLVTTEAIDAVVGGATTRSAVPGGCAAALAFSFANRPASGFSCSRIAEMSVMVRGGATRFGDWAWTADVRTKDKANTMPRSGLGPAAGFPISMLSRDYLRFPIAAITWGSKAAATRP